MPLDKNKLSNDIFNLFINFNQIQTSNLDAAGINQTLKSFSDGLSNAIHSYVAAADVDISAVNSSTDYQVPVTTVITSNVVTTKGSTDTVVTVKHKNTGKLK